MSEPNQPRKATSRWTAVLAVLLALLVLWPLSIGPVVWLLRHGIIDHETQIRLAETVYVPWKWLYDHNEAAHAFFDWYTTLWLWR